METSVSIGDTQAFRLRRAILIYGPAENRCGFATVHEVERSSEEATSRLGSARLLTTEFVRDLIKGLGRNTILELLPENILARNEFVTAWWLPATERVLFFHEESELAAISGKRFPMPALVFKVSGGQLFVRALAESRRPDHITSMYHAPFWNVWTDGRVCHGTMRVPKEFSVDRLSGWEQAFFGSNFSHTVRENICLHPQGIKGLWSAMDVLGSKVFPLNLLKPSGDTLEEFITHV